MLDILEVYERPQDPKNPVICFDEKSRQLLSAKRPGTPTGKSRPRRKDSEYVRHGTANLFVAVEPKAGKRHVKVTARRKGEDVAAFLETLVMDTYKSANKVILVCDNLNVHGPSTIRKHLPENRAQALLDKIEWHFTPKHASWLNMAEIEISILSRQCLARDMASREEMARHVNIWQKQRNQHKAKINWKFTRRDAIKKFKINSDIQ